LEGDDVESEEREAEETHPDEPTGNGELPAEPYEPDQRDDAPPSDESTESKPAEEHNEQAAQRASDDGMSKRPERQP
jgi:hypothetical protein